MVTMTLHYLRSLPFKDCKILYAQNLLNQWVNYHLASMVNYYLASMDKMLGGLKELVRFW